MAGAGTRCTWVCPRRFASTLASEPPTWCDFTAVNLPPLGPPHRRPPPEGAPPLDVLALPATLHMSAADILVQERRFLCSCCSRRSRCYRRYRCYRCYRCGRCRRSSRCSCSCRCHRRSRSSRCHRRSRSSRCNGCVPSSCRSPRVPASCRPRRASNCPRACHRSASRACRLACRRATCRNPPNRSSRADEDAMRWPPCPSRFELGRSGAALARDTARRGI